MEKIKLPYPNKEFKMEEIKFELIYPNKAFEK